MIDGSETVWKIVARRSSSVLRSSHFNHADIACNSSLALWKFLVYFMRKLSLQKASWLPLLLSDNLLMRRRFFRYNSPSFPPDQRHVPRNIHHYDQILQSALGEDRQAGVLEDDLTALPCT